MTLTISSCFPSWLFQIRSTDSTGKAPYLARNFKMHPLLLTISKWVFSLKTISRIFSFIIQSLIDYGVSHKGGLMFRIPAISLSTFPLNLWSPCIFLNYSYFIGNSILSIIILISEIPFNLFSKYGLLRNLRAIIKTFDSII